MADAEKNLNVDTAPAPATETAPRLAHSSSFDSFSKGGSPTDCPTQTVLPHRDACEDEDDCADAKFARPGRHGTFALAALALLILAWWVASVVLPLSRHRWLVQTLWAWFFVLTIASRYIPARTVARPISALFAPARALTHPVRLALGAAAVLGLTFGSAFGFARPAGTSVPDRVISLLGVFVFQLLIWGQSHARSRVRPGPVLASIALQQAIALFVLKSAAGEKFALWFATAVADFQTCAVEATAFIFDPDTAAKNWFFVASLGVIVFFGAWTRMLYWFGWMQWLTKQFAWFGGNLLGLSGAETFVAMWAPWFGQGSSALLVAPYVPAMTDSELFTVMATAQTPISALELFGTVKLGAAPLRPLLALSAIVMPSAAVNAKVARPEPAESVPLTATRASTKAAKLPLAPCVDLLDSLAEGAKLGLRVAGSILANFFAILALLVVVNGLLVWIFKGFGVPLLDLHWVAGAPLAPLVFFTGVPRDEVWRISKVVAVKLLNNPELGYAAFAKVAPGLSARGVAITQLLIAGQANLGSLGFQVGTMVALAPLRRGTIAKAAIPALLVATVTNFQAVAIAASVM